MKKFYIIVIMAVFILGITVYAASKTYEYKLYEKNNSDSIDVLKEDSNFMKYNVEIKNITKDVKITKDMALDIAKENGELKYSLQLEKNIDKVRNIDSNEITAVLCNFTDNDTKTLPESKKSLINCPVWIVTYHNLYMERFGGYVENIKEDDTYVLADMNIVIDANTGEILETFSYGI